jgi:hypothetical protein
MTTQVTDKAYAKCRFYKTFFRRNLHPLRLVASVIKLVTTFNNKLERLSLASFSSLD